MCFVKGPSFGSCTIHTAELTMKTIQKHSSYTSLPLLNCRRLQLQAL